MSVLSELRKEEKALEQAIKKHAKTLEAKLERVRAAIRAYGGSLVGKKDGRSVKSAETKKKMAAAQKARWAKVRAKKGKSSSNE
jgi:hypothetical protein